MYISFIVVKLNLIYMGREGGIKIQFLRKQFMKQIIAGHLLNQELTFSLVRRSKLLRQEEGRLSPGLVTHVFTAIFLCEGGMATAKRPVHVKSSYLISLTLLII